jgi:hypothetical protein
LLGERKQKYLHLECSKNKIILIREKEIHIEGWEETKCVIKGNGKILAKERE